MDREKLLSRLVRGELRNVDFRDITSLVQGFGFVSAGIKDSHHVFRRPDVDDMRSLALQGFAFMLTRIHHVFPRSDVPEMVNLQEVRGEAKPYQIRQFLRIIERHNLRLERNE